MGRPKKDKTKINISIDKELNQILDKKNINKSAFIESLIYKFLTLENNKSLISKPLSQNSNKHQEGIEPPTCGLQDRRSTSELLVLYIYIELKISLKSL